MILVIDNYDSFTWNLVQALGTLDRSLRVGRGIIVARNDEINAHGAEQLNDGRGPTRIIISPGPCTPREAGCSAEIIRAFAGRAPILGVCLGHQTLADMHEMSVVRHTPVHGKTSLIHHDSGGVFRGLSNPFHAARYHSLVVDERALPRQGWTVSAWTNDQDETGRTRRVVMGLRREWSEPGSALLEGVQFHPESFMTDQGLLLLRNFMEA